MTTSKENPLALLRYQTLTQADYGPWRADYLAVQCDREYGKPFNCSSCESALVPPVLEHVWSFASESYDALLLQLRFDTHFVENYGAPETAEVLLRFPRNSTVAAGGRETMEVELTLINKRPTRLGEAMFFTFNLVTPTSIEGHLLIRTKLPF